MRKSSQSILFTSDNVILIFFLNKIGEGFLENIVMCLDCGSVKVEFDIEPELMNGRK